MLAIESDVTHLANQAGYFCKLSSTQTDLDFYPRSQIKFHQSINRFLSWLDDIEETLVRADLILIPRILVHVRRNQNGKLLLLGRQRNGATNLSASATGRLHNLFCRCVNQAMVKGLQPDSDTLVLQGTSP